MNLFSLEYVAVVLSMFLCIWSLYIGIKCRPADIPFGAYGRAVLIFNSFVLTVVCAVTFIWHVYEFLQGKI